MARTTFSGPVASQNGFVAPTFTSTTLPFFTEGNIVYVSDLNTLAFGGVDQWYDQSTGTGLGTGGNVGPTPTPGTTYTINVDYGSNGMTWLSISSTTGVIQVNEGSWTNVSGANQVMSKPVGTAFTFVNLNSGLTFSGVLDTAFSGGAGSFTANVTWVSSPGGSMGYENMASITI